MRLGNISLLALAALTLGASGSAQVPAPAAPAAPPAAASTDPATAPAGAYSLDPRHSSVIARIGHGGGISLSTFRFNVVSGSLAWNPAKPDASSLNVKIDLKSIDSPVAGFAEDIAGDRFLKTAQFPEASFVSTGIAVAGPTAGRITGNLTFMGVTKPVVVEATLVGAGKGMRNTNVIGFSGTASFKRSDFGFTAMTGSIGDEVEMLLDVEFNKPAAAS